MCKPSNEVASSLNGVISLEEIGIFDLKIPLFGFISLFLYIL